MSSPTTRFIPFAAALSLLAGSALRAADPPWMIGSFPGFDVYTNATVERSRRLLDDVLELQRDFEVVWPVPATANLPRGRIIICDQPRQFLSLTGGTLERSRYKVIRAFSGSLSLAVNAGFQISVSNSASIMGGMIENPAMEMQEPLRKKIALADFFAGNSMQGLYANYYMALLGERIPPWLFYGLHRLIAHLDCTDDDIGFPPAATDTSLNIRRRGSGSETSLNAALRDGRFLTLEELFNSTKEPPAVREPAYTLFRNGRPAGPRERDFWGPGSTHGLFIDESYEFIQFCLFAQNGRYREAFIKFAHAASNGPLDEAGFRDLFGKGYRDMLLELWGYGYTDRDRTYRFPHPLPPPSIAFRPATPAEIQAMLASWTDQWKARDAERRPDFENP